MQWVELRSERREYVFAQRAHSTFETDIELIRNHDEAYERPDILPGCVDYVRSRDNKLLSNGTDHRLSELQKENENASDDNPEVVDELQRELADFRERVSPGIEAGQDEALSDSRQKQLRQLGYSEQHLTPI